jgi:hypothetical protein
MRARFVMAILAMMVLLARPSSAQETGRVGLTMAFPAAVGIIWHATDGLALRPDFTFSQSSSGGASLTASSASVGLGVSALFYVRKWDNLRAYLSPRFGYQRSSFTYPGSAPASVSTNTYSGSGSFGAEYLLHRRFAVFAETGLIYSHLNSDAAASGLSLDSSSHTWGTRAGVGAILYF